VRISENTFVCTVKKISAASVSKKRKKTVELKKKQKTTGEKGKTFCFNLQKFFHIHRVTKIS